VRALSVLSRSPCYRIVFIQRAPIFTLGRCKVACRPLSLVQLLVPSPKMATPDDPDVACSAYHSEVVAAPFNIVWGLLVEKVRLPTKHVPGVSAVTIVKDDDEGVERRMVHAVKGEIHEHITCSTTNVDGRRKGLVTFKMLSDPVLEGFVLNEAHELEDGSTEVAYTMNWRFQSQIPSEARKPPFPDGGAGAIAGAVRHMKAGAEAAAAASATSTTTAS
jgi:hypothetical protein